MKTWTIDPAHTNIGFAVKHLGLLTVRGRFDKFDANVVFEGENPQSVEAKVDLASVSTGQEGRDTHLRSGDFFEVEKHPHMTFKSSSVDSSGESLSVTGDLTIKGTTRPITLKGSISPVFKDTFGGRRRVLALEGRVNRKDWGLVWNVVGEDSRLLVGDDVKIEIEAEAMEADKEAQGA